MRAEEFNKFLCELFGVDSINITVDGWEESEEDTEESAKEQTPTFETSNPICKKEDYPIPDDVFPVEDDLYPTRAIFHDPATIVFWNDGTKTVAMRETNDDFDSEKGLMVAILKKILGGGEMHRWMDFLKTFNAETTKNAEE